jgi:hypothetical protein
MIVIWARVFDLREGLLELQTPSHHEPTIDLPRRDIKLPDAVKVRAPFRRDKLHLEKHSLQILVFISVAVIRSFNQTSLFTSKYVHFPTYLLNRETYLA